MTLRKLVDTRRIEMLGRRRRSNQLLDVLIEVRGCWKLKEEALYSPCREMALEEATDLSLNQTAE
jgi:hypothetical protein